jgi:hypothetical protein
VGTVVSRKHGGVDKAPRLWRLVNWWCERKPRGEADCKDTSQLPLLRHQSSGAEVFHPYTANVGDSGEASLSDRSSPSRRAPRAYICVGTAGWQRWRTPVVVERAMEPISVFAVIFERGDWRCYRWIVPPRGGLFVEPVVRRGRAPQSRHKMQVRYLRAVKGIAGKVRQRETPKITVALPRVVVRGPKARIRGERKAVRVRLEFDRMLRDECGERA